MSSEVETLRPGAPATKVVAHRGRLDDGPENAIEALSALPGRVDGVEVDVRLSREGLCVLLHDATLERTTDGRGRVEEHDVAELARLTVVGGGRIPRLDTYLAAVVSTQLAPVMIDVKDPGPDRVDAPLEVVAASGIADRCVLLVRSIEQLARVRQLAADARLGLLGLAPQTADAQLDAAERHGAEVVFLRPGDQTYLADRELVRAARGGGLGIGASAIEDIDVLDCAADDGCSVVISDVEPSWSAAR